MKNLELLINKPDKYKKIIDLAIKQQLTKWKCGFHDPFINLNAFSKAYNKIIKYNYMIESTLDLNKTSAILKKLYKNNNNFVILIAKGRVSSYYFTIYDYIDNMFIITSNLKTFKKITKSEMLELFYISDSDYSSLRVYNICKKK